MRRDARDIDTACLQVHDGEDVERVQSGPCLHLDRRKIRCNDRGPVCFLKRGARICSLWVRCRLSAVCLQYVDHGEVGDVVIQILECSLSPIESLHRILPCGLNSGIDDDHLMCDRPGFRFAVESNFFATRF